MHKPNVECMTLHTVLVVDDEPASVRAVRRALADAYPVIGVSAASEGLALLAREPIALVIADQRMPEMTGTELFARIADNHPDVVRILLTGYTGIETLVDAINAGHVYYYLTKPWEPSELRLVVRRGLERHAAEAERRRLLHEVEQACRRAERSAEQKSRLLTVAAHELGTPVHVLAHALAFVAEAEIPAAVRPWVETAERSAVWLGHGLQQMLSAARWRNGFLKLQPRALPLAPLLDDVRATYVPICAHRGLRLHVAVTPALPAAVADPLWLRRAVSNLVSNAVRFTPDGGAVTVTTGIGAGTVDIGVTDTGIGIDAAVLDEVFEPFSAACGDLSLHASGRFEFGARGLGLGLAITKAIIDGHGGTIQAWSQPGVGSRFTIRLPAAAAVSERELG